MLAQESEVMGGVDARFTGAGALVAGIQLCCLHKCHLTCDM